MSINQKGLTPLILIVLAALGVGIGLYLVKNPAIFNPKAAFDGTDDRNYPLINGVGDAFGDRAAIPVNNAWVDLLASPNPCILNTSGLCTTKLTWNSKYADLRITIKESPGSLFAQAAYGSQDAPWISASGATFEAYSGNTLVGSVFVKGVTSSGDSPLTRCNTTFRLGKGWGDSCPTGYRCDNSKGTVCTKNEPSNSCSGSGFCQPGGPQIFEKLNSRLQQLVRADLDGTLPASTEEQNEMLGLSRKGSGSLSRMGNGKIIVDVRLQDTSSAIQAGLTNEGAEILSVSPEYGNITIGIPINRLNNLANIRGVQAVIEVIVPSHGMPAEIW